MSSQHASDVPLHPLTIPHGVTTPQPVPSSQSLTTIPKKQSSEKEDSKNKLKAVVFDEHQLTIAQLVERYGTRIEESAIPKSMGLSESRAAELLAQNGPNGLTPPPQKSLFLRFLSCLSGLFNVLLLVAGALSFILYAIPPPALLNIYLGIILIAVAILNSIIEFYQEYKSQAILESFKKLIPATTRVIRDGQIKEISALDLVLGDVIVLRNGDKVPADVRLLACNEMKVDNSSLTGESEPQERSTEKGSNNPLEASNLAFYGSLIVNGDGYGVVIRCGDATVLGQIAILTCGEVKRDSQLSEEITYFVRVMAAIAIVTAIVFFVIGIAVIKYDLSLCFSFAVGIFVAFVPQGLPATVTVMLTIAASRLSKMNVLVKDLHGVETLGSITVLATDKTGTLTQNKMTVVATWLNLVIEGVHDLLQEPEQIKEHHVVSGTRERLMQMAILCSKSHFDEADMAKPVAERRVFGDATETGLLRYAAAHLDVSKLMNDYPRVFEIPFSSATKWHLTVHKKQHARGHFTMFLKGAPERIVKMCTQLRLNEDCVAWQQEHTDAFNKAYEQFAGEGQRVLAFAELELPGEAFPLDFQFKRTPQNFPLEGFTFVGLASLMDPPKRGVRKAVAACRTAGIQVVMVTGDHPLTAEAIARKIGLIQKETAHQVAKRLQKPVQMITDDEYEAVVVHGDRLDTMSDEEWDRILSKREIVFARTAPHHKLMIVMRCQAKGHIVGVSGDGVNDAPALKKADLGISMNKTGSDVSKEAAAMILLDDNFPSIVVGIAQGRLIFSNLKKSIRYTLNHIMTEVMAFLVFVAVGIPLPFSSILILFIDLGTELCSALSLAWELPEGDLMLVPPRKVLCTPQKNYAAFDLERGSRRGSISSQGRNPNASNQPKPPSIWQRFVSVISRPFQRNATGEVLVDTDLLVWAYLEGGMIVTIGCFGAYLVELYLSKIDFSQLYQLANDPANYFTPDATQSLTLTDGTMVDGNEQFNILTKAQTAYFFGAVSGQWFALLLVKRRYNYPIDVEVFKNIRSWGGVFVSICIFVFLSTPPFFSPIAQFPHGLSLLPPIATGFLFILYEYIRKWLRFKGYFGGVPKRNENLLELVRTTSTA